MEICSSTGLLQVNSSRKTDKESKHIQIPMPRSAARELSIFQDHIQIKLNFNLANFNLLEGICSRYIARNLLQTDWHTSISPTNAFQCRNRHQSQVNVSSIKISPACANMTYIYIGKFATNRSNFHQETLSMYWVKTSNLILTAAVHTLNWTREKVQRNKTVNLR